MKERGANPLSGCLPMLLQLPLFIVMYQVIHGLTRRASGGGFDPKYLSAASPLRHALETGGGKMMSFGMDLAGNARDALRIGVIHGSPFLALIAAVVASGYIAQHRISRRAPNPAAEEDPATRLSQRMTKAMPLMYLFVGFTLPAGVVLYFLISNLVRIGQQEVISRLFLT